MKYPVASRSIETALESCLVKGPDSFKVFLIPSVFSLSVFLRVLYNESRAIALMVVSAEILGLPSLVGCTWPTAKVNPRPTDLESEVPST